jgi:hypothetical protein
LNAGATDAEGNTITFTIISGSLPGSGLTISSSTGAITGTLASSPSLGNYPFVVRASTTEGVIERQFSIQVIPLPFVTASGGTETTPTGYKVHTFNSSGSLVVTAAGASPENAIEYLVIGGGGGGGGRYYAGGGGAGGYRTSVVGQNSGGGLSAEAVITPTVTTYTVTVGGGGPGGGGGTNGTVGENSVFGAITSLGGGFGAADPNNGGVGGSGGGASSNAATNGGLGTAGQGFRGAVFTTPVSGGGGGGA